MKKYLIAALLSFLVAEAKAETFQAVPAGPSQALATADYGGVSRSTVSLSSANVLCFSGVGSVVGFVVSSGATQGDYILFRDTASLIAGALSGGGSGTLGDYSTNQEFARVMLNNTTSTVNGGTLGTTYLFPKPIRVYKGLTASINSGIYNMVTILYNKLN